jgi:hypothetical protein
MCVWKIDYISYTSNLIGGAERTLFKVICKKIENLSLASYLFEPWFRRTPLRVQYPRLFQASQQRDSKVGEMGKWGVEEGSIVEEGAVCLGS